MLCAALPVSLQAAARLLPCPCSTSICRSLMTICSVPNRRPLGIGPSPSRLILSSRLGQKRPVRSGDKLLQPPVLVLKLLQPLGLIDVETAVLLAPAIKRLLCRSDFLASHCDVLALALQHLNLAQLGDNLLRTQTSSFRHGLSPSRLNSLKIG